MSNVNTANHQYCIPVGSCPFAHQVLNTNVCNRRTSFDYLMPRHQSILMTFDDRLLPWKTSAWGVETSNGAPARQDPPRDAKVEQSLRWRKWLRPCANGSNLHQSTTCSKRRAKWCDPTFLHHQFQWCSLFYFCNSRVPFLVPIGIFMNPSPHTIGHVLTHPVGQGSHCGWWWTFGYPAFCVCVNIAFDLHWVVTTINVFFQLQFISTYYHLFSLIIWLPLMNLGNSLAQQPSDRVVTVQSRSYKNCGDD